MVLSGVPVEAADGGESLAEYMAHEQVLGPVAPVDLAASYDQQGPTYEGNTSFGVELPEGEGCEELPEGCGEGGGGAEGSGDGGGGEEGGGTSTVTGSIGLEGFVGGVSASVSGASGSFSMDEEGNFVFEMENPEIGTLIEITLTDSLGNTSTVSWTYNG
jgi:hypothetical protein